MMNYEELFYTSLENHTNEIQLSTIKTLCNECCRLLTKVSDLDIRMPHSDKTNNSSGASLAKRREEFFEACYNHSVKFNDNVYHNVRLYVEQRKKELQYPLQYALKDNHLRKQYNSFLKKYIGAVNKYFFSSNKRFENALIYRLVELELTYHDCASRLKRMEDEQRLKNVLKDLKQKRTISRIVIKTEDSKHSVDSYSFSSNVFLEEFARQVIKNYTITQDDVLHGKYYTIFQELPKKLPMYMVNEIIRTMSEYNLFPDVEDKAILPEVVCLNIYNFLVTVLPQDFLNGQCIKTKRGGAHITPNEKAVYIRKLIKPEVCYSLKEVKSYVKSLISYLP